jgi:hypothetical protein
MRRQLGRELDAVSPRSISSSLSRREPAALAALCVSCLLAACSGGSKSKPPAPAETAGTTASAGTTGATPPAMDASAPDRGAGAGGRGTAPAAGSGMTAPRPMRDPQLAAILGNGCASATVRSDVLPPNILFVIDRSGSMTCNPPPLTESSACEAAPARADASQPSKWEITRDALLTAIGKLPAAARIAVTYFSNDNQCGVSSIPSVPLAELGGVQRMALETSLRQVEPAGGTPLVGATILAYKYLHTLALQGTLLGNDFVVLLTDGAQSEQCGDESRCTTAEECTNLLTDQEAARAASPGSDIRTFVIGAPGSEPARVSLSKIARNGGTAPPGCDPAQGDCHFDMTRGADFSASLSEALAAIAGEAITCELPLPAAKDTDFDPKLVNVIFSSGDSSSARIVPEDTRTGCDTAQGWQYNDDVTRIRLCGSVCSDVRTDPKARVDVILGCPVVAPQ